MVGILTEKPSAMRNFANALGGVSGTYNNEKYTIVAARGHLFELVPPDQQVGVLAKDKYRSWDLKNLPWDEKDFHWKKQLKKGGKDIFTAIGTVLSNCDEIVIATDVDPTGEGELLAWEILDELRLNNKKYTRMYFVDEAPKSIQTAFVTRKPIESMNSDMDYIKADFRAKFDFMSMQFTRVATACGDGRSTLRQGRLKSAMVVIVGDGLKALKEYKKIPYYQNRFKDENGVVYSYEKEPKYATAKTVPNTYAKSAVVLDKKELKKQAPPALLDLASLSSILSNKGIKAKDILATYQKMYEDQVVSYPRTEDKCITLEQYNELLPLVDKIAKVVGIDTKLLTHRAPRKTHIKSGGSHGANRPGVNVPNKLDDLSEYGACAPLIYDILARNYLAMLCEDYVYESQKGHLAKYPNFTGFTTMAVSKGYKVVFDTDDDSENENNSENAKGLGKLAQPFVYKGFPTKPPTPTMKWLMKQLEKYDVGTGATRTTIYADVTSDSSKYPLLVEKRGKLTMTLYGEMSYYLLQDTHIGNVKITEQLMSDMRGIAQGELDTNECLHKMQQLVADDINTMSKNSIIMKKELNIMAGDIERYTGTWNGKQVSFKRVWSNYRFTDDECEKLLKGEQIEIRGLISSKGNEYGVVGRLSEQSYNGRKFVGFERTGFAQATTPPKKWSGHTFTDDEIKLLLAGRSVVLDDCVSSRTGKSFSCKVSWCKKDDGSMGIVPSFG